MTQAIDSSRVGYLQSTSSSPYGEALEDIFQRCIVGITDLPGNLVRPKNQPHPPTIPAYDVDWASFRVSVLPVQWNAFKTIKNDLEYTVEGTEQIELLVSFFGPHYQDMERQWRDGIQLGQNRDELTAAGIVFEQFADPVVVPLLLKEQWVKHVDIRGTFQRWAVREYKVRNILSADGTINADRTPAGEIIGTFHTDPPPS